LGVTVIAYSPLKYGLLTGKYTPQNPPPGVRRGQFGKEYLARIQPFLAELKRVADAHGKTLPQVAIHWVLRRGALPIPGAKNKRQADENAGALGWALTADETAHLDELSARLYREH
jgi:aryl-alcohol dehydrogenase-like predicted oxidoreductase